ncbi:MAG TPA: hypothetical protein VHR44_18070, partial [Beijerinckiaceae bacterium]|nr:hypothetical protein [Beijerinckiaceae bacterium]
YSPEPTELQRFTSIDINRRRRAHDCGPFEFAWRGNGCTSGKSMPSGRRIGELMAGAAVAGRASERLRRELRSGADNFREVLAISSLKRHIS